MKKLDIRITINQFIQLANAFEVDKALLLSATDAVIDDVSVGEKFNNIVGVKKYLEQFFVGYNTTTKLMSVDLIDSLNANAQVDFTGNFGHETGVLNFTINNDGLIKIINADLD